MIIPIPKELEGQTTSKLFERIHKAQKRFVINYGGTAAGKSFCATQKEILAVLERNIKTLVIRKVGNTLRDSVIPSFLARIDEMNLTEYFSFNKTDRTLTHRETGSQIIFRGLDDPDKLKSFEGLTRILVEEAAELEFKDFMELNRRARGKEHIQITLTFNPIDEHHWLKKHFFDRENPDADIIHSTYKDNNYLTKGDKEQIEQMSLYDNNQYRIYALGEWGVLTNDAPWLFMFNKSQHVRESLPLLDGFPIHLSFDFNRDPLTCVAVQMSQNRGARDSFVHFIKEFSGSITLEDMCRNIRTAFPNGTFFITGDSSGNRGDIAMKDPHATYYRFIQGYLGLGDRQLHLNNYNLRHGVSRTLINSLLGSYPNILISNEDCPLLINDCITARVDDSSNLPGALRKDRNAYKMDLFDCFRYFFQQYFTDYAGSIGLGKKAA